MTYLWYAVEIEDEFGNLRRIPLEHMYPDVYSAESEAEDIADEVYQENDIAWSVVILGERI